MIELRPYQHEGIAACPQAMRAGRRVLYVASTGSGKTILFAALAASVATKGKRAIILVHRRELVRQTAAKLEGFGIGCGYVVAGKPADLGPPITVAAVQTLSVRPSLVLEYDVVVIDEAHHAVAGTWGKALERLPVARILGVTATPSAWTGAACATCSTRWCQAPRSQKRWGRIALTASCSAWRAPASTCGSLPMPATTSEAGSGTRPASWACHEAPILPAGDAEPWRTIQRGVGADFQGSANYISPVQPFFHRRKMAFEVNDDASRPET